MCAFVDTHDAGTYNGEYPLVCNRKSGCYFRDARQKTDTQLRTLYKTNGGAIQEAANGHMWVESNVDGGDWYALDVLRGHVANRHACAGCIASV